MKIVTVEQMQQIDQRCAHLGLPTDVLMENAGRAVAETTKEIIGGASGKQIVVLIGPGNNGGDGLVAGRYLHKDGAKVSLYLCSERSSSDANIIRAKELAMTFIEASRDLNLDTLNALLSSADAVIDAIFGTGRSRALRGVYPQILRKVSTGKENRPSLRIIALDVPTGLNSDTGEVDDACLNADNTITLGFPKLGLFNFPGAEKAGKLTIADIGIPPHLADELGVKTELITEDWVKSVLPKRPPGANKGTFGKVMAVAGSINYVGAAYLACSSAMRAGAGLVTLATATSLHPILASKLTEVTYLPLPESNRGIISPEAARLVRRELEQYNVMLIGCGLGQGQATTNFVRSILLSPKNVKTKVALPPAVIDADALNTLAKIPDWWRILNDNVILTPHPSEMSRLAGISVEDLLKDRVYITINLAVQWRKIIVLKGANTLIASPDGNCRINPMANPGLASAGTGDVLTGVIAGLLSQGVSLFNAAVSGVYLHGQAGEMVKARLGDAGMLASDLLPELPLLIKKIKER